MKKKAMQQILKHKGSKNLNINKHNICTGCTEGFLLQYTRELKGQCCTDVTIS